MKVFHAGLWSVQCTPTHFISSINYMNWGLEIDLECGKLSVPPAWNPVVSCHMPGRPKSRILFHPTKHSSRWFQWLHPPLWLKVLISVISCCSFLLEWNLALLALCVTSLDTVTVDDSTSWWCVQYFRLKVVAWHRYNFWHVISVIQTAFDR